MLFVMRSLNQPISDSTLIEAYRNRQANNNLYPQTDSGIRSRRAELVQHGLVVDSGLTDITATGRASVCWYAKPEENTVAA